MSWQQDRQGVEGLPLRLLITAVVLAITVPIMFGALKAYDRSRLRQETEAEIDRISEQLQLLYMAGAGNGRVLEVDVASGMFSRLDYLRLGAPRGEPLSSTARYSISGQEEVVLVVKDPNVPMSTPDNDTLELPPGHYRVRAECVLTEEDLNGDGLAPDLMVVLELMG